MKFEEMIVLLKEKSSIFVNRVAFTLTSLVSFESLDDVRPLSPSYVEKLFE